MNYLARCEKKERDRYTDNNRVKDGKEAYTEEITDVFSYSIDYETIIEYKSFYSGYVTTDGIEIKDSDWEAVYSWSI